MRSQTSIQREPDLAITF
jgi:5'-AMP-activated protein kinase, catalytic alpha subunit